MFVHYRAYCCILSVFILPTLGGGCSQPATGGSGGSGGTQEPPQTDDTQEPPGTDDPQEPPVGATTTFDVTMQDNAKVVPPETVQDKLKSATPDMTEITFDASATDVAALAPGDVVIFSGHSLRRIESVNMIDGEIVVETSAAAFNDVVRDGQVGWMVPVNFATGPQPVLSADADPSFTFDHTVDETTTAKGLVLASETFKVTGKVEPWDVSLEFSPEADRINVEITGSLTYGGKTFASVKGKGFITNFNHSASLQYADSELVDAQLSNQDFSGEMDIEWHAFTELGVNITEVLTWKLPLEIPIPINVGGIPLTLKIKCEARVVPELRSQGILGGLNNASSGGHFKIVYTADAGFAVADDAVNATGSLSSGDITIPGETVSASLELATGMGVGVEFPRIELGLPGDVAVAYISLDSYVFSLWNPGFLSGGTTCQCGGANFKATAGFQLGLFGKVGLEDSIELWKKDLDSCVDDIPCD